MCPAALQPAAGYDTRAAMNNRVNALLRARLEGVAQAMEAESKELKALAATALTGSTAAELSRDAIDLELAAGHVREILSRLPGA